MDAHESVTDHTGPRQRLCVCVRVHLPISGCVGLIDLVFVSFNRREAVIGFSKDVTSWKWQCLLTLGSSILLLEIKTKEKNRGRLTTNWAKQSRKELTETAFVYLKCVCVCVIMIKANVIERPLGFKLPEFQFDQTPTWLRRIVFCSLDLKPSSLDDSVRQIVSRHANPLVTLSFHQSENFWGIYIYIQYVFAINISRPNRLVGFVLAISIGRVPWVATISYLQTNRDQYDDSTQPTPSINRAEKRA